MWEPLTKISSQNEMGNSERGVSDYVGNGRLCDKVTLNATTNRELNKFVHP